MNILRLDPRSALAQCGQAIYDAHMGATERDGVGGTQAVDRALGVLLCFSDAEPKLRVADVARRLGVTQSTASRLLAALEAGGFVERDTRAGAYQLGATLITLAGIALNQS